MALFRWMAASPLGDLVLDGIALGGLALIAVATAAAADPLDAADEAFRAASYRQAWAGPLGQIQHWANPASGHAGTVQALAERPDPATQLPCREVLERVTADDQTSEAYAVGCRGGDGAWHIVQTSATDAASPAGTAGHGIVPADVTPYVAPADISADGNGTDAPAGLPAEVHIFVPWHGAPGTLPPAPASMRAAPSVGR